ncbi:MAG: ribbon-helix-helix protein, CopG family [Nitrospira sp.]|nr:ribbon-helix-helix protein, CopG family [Nitrospira sp.]
MKFPQCTIVSVNLPKDLLEEIDALASKRILNRSACVRDLVTEGLKSHGRSGSPEEKQTSGFC